MTRLPFKLQKAIERRPHSKRALLLEAAAKLKTRRLHGNLSVQGHADLLAIEQELEKC